MYSLSDSDDLSDVGVTIEKESNRSSDSECTIIDFDTGPSSQNYMPHTVGNILQITDHNHLTSSQPNNNWDLKKFDYKHENTTTDPELEALLMKYSSIIQTQQGNASAFSSSTTDKLVESIELSSDEELPYIPVKTDLEVLASNAESDDAEMSFTEHIFKYNYVSNTSVDKDNLINDAILSTNSPKKKKKTKTKVSSVEKERKQLEKAAEKVKKKEEEQRAKLIKQVLATANKNSKPEECMKFITVFLDIEIANEDYGGELLNALHTASISYRLQSQLVPKTVTWSRTVQNPTVDDNGILQQTSETLETNRVLILMNWKEALDLIHKKQFCERIKSLQNILTNKELFLGIYGFKGYFNYQKSQKQKELRKEITKSAQTSTSHRNNKYKDAPKISWYDLEFALTELQILCSCCHQRLETNVEVGNLITHFTKAVAQIPYKSEKYQKQQEANRYIQEDNKNVVHVGKDGTGLQRLWQQQLMSFPLARIEHADAITSQYPTLQSLMEEYSRCSETEGEKLLQDIPVRRGAGPLITVRKIGPELSKKIYTVLTSLDGKCVF